MKRIEEEKRLKAEAEKKEEIDKIKAECRGDMQQEIDKLEKEHQIRMLEMREEIRRDIADKTNGLFARIGNALDKVMEQANDLIQSGARSLINLFKK